MSSAQHVLVVTTSLGSPQGRLCNDLDRATSYTSGKSMPATANTQLPSDMSKQCMKGNVTRTHWGPVLASDTVRGKHFASNFIRRPDAAFRQDVQGSLKPQ